MDKTIEFDRKIEYKISERWPLIVDDPYPYLPLVDLDGVFREIVPEIDQEVVELIEGGLIDILEEAALEGSSFMPVPMEVINYEMETVLAGELSRLDKKVAVIDLDKYIAEEWIGDGFFRLGMSRGIDGGLVARPGFDMRPDDQIDGVVSELKRGNYDEVIFVDDVLAFGDTMIPVINQFKSELEGVNFRVFVGLASSGGSWSGLEKLREATGINAEYLVLAKPSEENERTTGMAMPAVRDFTFLGGKISWDEEKQLALNYPYFLPFSTPVLSLMEEEKRNDISIRLIDFNLGLVDILSYYLGREITVGDLIDCGYGVPSSRFEEINQKVGVPQRETQIKEYLTKLRENYV